MAEFKHKLKERVNNNLKDMCKHSAAPKKGKKLEESVYDRIEKRRAELGLSIKEIVDGIAAKGHKLSVQAIYQLKNDPKKSLKGRNALEVSIMLKCNELWLLTGKGPKARITKDLSPDEQLIIDNYRQLVDPDAKEQILNLAKLLGKGGNNPQK